MTVIRAEFAPASKIQAEQANGNIIWRSGNAIVGVINKIWGSIDIKFFKGTNVLLWNSPPPLKLFHYFQWYSGYEPARGFIEDIPTFIGTWHFIVDQEEVFNAFFREQRYGHVFMGSNTLKYLLQAVKESFPNETIEEQDLVFTSKDEEAKVNHAFFEAMLNGKNFKETAIPIIREEINEALHRWSTASEYVNITQEARILACKIITRILFQHKIGNVKLSECMTFFNEYFVKLRLNKVKEPDKMFYKGYLDIFKEEVQAVLDKNPDLFKDQKMTTGRKIAHAFVALFAGQETSAIAIVFAVYWLSRNKPEQDRLSAEIKAGLAKRENNLEQLQCVQEFFNANMKRFPPIHGVSRTLEVDTLLVYRLEGEAQDRSIFFPAEHTIAAMMMRSTKHEMKNYHFFGGGPHICPGQQLARLEFTETITAVLAQHEIIPESMEEVKLLGKVTLQPEKDILVTFPQRMGN